MRACVRPCVRPCMRACVRVQDRETEMTSLGGDGRVEVTHLNSTIHVRTRTRVQHLLQYQKGRCHSLLTHARMHACTRACMHARMVARECADRS